jgi:hypothetical protein
MGLNEWLKAFNWVTDRIGQFSNWLKKKNRRNNVQSMEKDVATDNNVAINKRVSELRKKAKDREDSR